MSSASELAEECQEPERPLNFFQKHLGWLLLVGVWIVYTWPLWFDAGNAYLGDLALVDVPGRVYAARAIRAGWFPAWTDALLGGVPLFAESQASMAYPLFLLFVLFPEPKTGDWFLAVHYLLFGLGMYLLARQQGANRVGAGLAAVLFMTGWGLRYTHEAAAILSAWSWQPLSVWLLGEYGRGRRAALWPLAFSVGMSLCACPAVVVLSTFHICAAYWLFRCGRIGWPERTKAALACSVLSIGLAAVQIVPLYGYYRESNRRSKGFEELAAGTAPPWFIFAPWGVGPQEPQNLDERPRSAWPAHAMYAVEVVALAAGAAGFWRRKEVRFWWGVLAYMLLLGMESPLLSLVGSIPPFSLYRYAGGYLWGAQTCTFVLIAFGISRIADWWSTASAGWPRGNWLPGICVAIVLGAALVSGNFRRYLSDGPFYSEFNPTLAHELANWKNQQGHIRVLGPGPPPAPIHSIGSWSEAAWRDRAAALAPDHNLIHNIPSINHYMQFSGTVTNKRLFELGQLLLQRNPNAFRAAAVTHLSLEQADPPPGYERIPSGSGFFYKCQEPRPPAWMVFQTQQIDEPAARIEQLTRDDFNPFQTAIVETALPALDEQPAAAPAVEMIPEIRGHKEFQVNSAARGLLVMSNTYFTQMRATIDGAPAPVVPVNHAFCGVVVPPGEHLVVLSYDPWEIYLGLAISAASLALVAWQVMRHAWPARASQPVAAAAP